MRVPIAAEGYPFFLPPLVAGLGLAAARGLGLLAGHSLALGILAGSSLVLGLFLLFFFRDPERAVGGDSGSVVAPADGRVVRLVELPDRSTELSIFLSPLDVHVNRAPIDGRLEAAEHRPGRYRPAFLGGASHVNEQLRLRLAASWGTVLMNEVTGVLVRRIVLRKAAGDEVRRGERIGIMKFGSRIDLVLPASVRLRVRAGERVRGSETVLGQSETS